jgi:hypothetical protein
MMLFTAAVLTLAGHPIVGVCCFFIWAMSLEAA